MGDYEEVIEELHVLLETRRAPVTLTSVIRSLRAGDPRTCYWYTTNEWDKIRSYPDTHSVLAKIPHVRKFFREMRKFSERMGWKDRVAEWDKLLVPYAEQESSDLGLDT